VEAGGTFHTLVESEQTLTIVVLPIESNVAAKLVMVDWLVKDGQYRPTRIWSIFADCARRVNPMSVLLVAPVAADS
jgi:uncharacterized Fe-S cluster-containing MiaB family protein